MVHFLCIFPWNDNQCLVPWQFRCRPLCDSCGTGRWLRPWVTVMRWSTGTFPRLLDARLFTKGIYFQPISRYCWWTKSCTTKDDNYPIIYKVLAIPGGAGFLPSTVFQDLSRDFNTTSTWIPIGNDGIFMLEFIPAIPMPFPMEHSDNAGAPHLLLDLQSAAFLLGNAEITLSIAKTSGKTR